MFKLTKLLKMLDKDYWKARKLEIEKVRKGLFPTHIWVSESVWNQLLEEQHKDKSLLACYAGIEVSLTKYISDGYIVLYNDKSMIWYGRKGARFL